jgi:cytochrome c oxidase subunit 4
MAETHETQAAEAGHEEHEHHIVGPKVYALILLVLLVGTALTVGASYIDMGPWNPVVAIAIACTKATFVVLFFMHIKYSSKLMQLTVGAGVFTFLILVGMSLSDYISRAWGLW